MAGYRPKSLDELNSIFDKTMAAEKAIRKSSSLIEKGEEGFSTFTAEKDADVKESAVPSKHSEEITDSVSEFIAKFSAQTEAEPVREKPQMTVLTHEPVKKEAESEEAPAVEKEETESPRETEKPSRDELFNDYARIMADDEDDSPAEKKLSRKEKKKLKKKNKQSTETAAEEAESASADEPAEKAEEADEPSEEISEEAENGNSTPENETDDFEFPENYTPEWMKEDDEQEEADKKANSEKKSSKSVRTLVKAILSILLVAVISISALATVLKTVVAVNTGKPFSDKYYVFTSAKAYEDSAITEGSLIITEDRDIQEGEVFAYVDYVSKSFEFGKRTDTITNENGEIIYVTEKDGGRTLVSENDCRGAVYLTYENYGNIVKFLNDNYIVIIAASAVAVLAIVLVFALALRTKKEDEEYGDSADESSDGLSEESDEDFENIFATIE